MGDALLVPSNPIYSASLQIEDSSFARIPDSKGVRTLGSKVSAVKMSSGTSFHDLGTLESGEESLRKG